MIGTRTTQDIYKEYAKKLLTENPSYWGKYYNRIKNYYIYRNFNGVPQVVITYKIFKQILSTWFKGAAEYITRGYRLQLGHKLGYIAGRRVERNHANKQVNWKASEAKWKRTGVRKDPVYYTDDDWVRVGWQKTRKIKNGYLYRFNPAEGNKSGKGFRAEFSAANKADDLLKFRYKYYPFLKDKDD